MASNREQDLMQLQQDAVRRVMEMQRQAQAKVQPRQEPSPHQKPPKAPENPPPKSSSPKPASKTGLLKSILGSTGLEEEQLLLLGLGYLLYKEGADQKLLLALLYLLL